MGIKKIHDDCIIDLIVQLMDINVKGYLNQSLEAFSNRPGKACNRTYLISLTP